MVVMTGGRGGSTQLSMMRFTSRIRTSIKFRRSTNMMIRRTRMLVVVLIYQV